MATPEAVETEFLDRKQGKVANHSDKCGNDRGATMTYRLDGTTFPKTTGAARMAILQNRSHRVLRDTFLQEGGGKKAGGMTTWSVLEDDQIQQAAFKAASDGKFMEEKTLVHPWCDFEAGALAAVDLLEQKGIYSLVDTPLIRWSWRGPARAPPATRSWKPSVGMASTSARPTTAAAGSPARRQRCA